MQNKQPISDAGNIQSEGLKLEVWYWRPIQSAFALLLQGQIG